MRTVVSRGTSKPAMAAMSWAVWPMTSGRMARCSRFTTTGSRRVHCSGESTYAPRFAKRERSSSA